MEKDEEEERKRVGRGGGGGGGFVGLLAAMSGQSSVFCWWIPRNLKWEAAGTDLQAEHFEDELFV